MSIRAQFASLSTGAAVDQQTGSLSVFDVIEEVRTPQVPIQLQTLVISMAFLKSDSDEFKGKVVIHLLTPDGKQQMLGSGDLIVPAAQKRVRAVFRFGGFPVYNFGMHRFVVSWLNGENVKVGESLLDFEAVQVAGEPPKLSNDTSGRPPLSH